MNWCSFSGIPDSLSNFRHLRALGVKNIEGGLGAACKVPRLERHVDIVGMGVIGRLDHSPADLVISV